VQPSPALQHVTFLLPDVTPCGNTVPLASSTPFQTLSDVVHQPETPRAIPRTGRIERLDPTSPTAEQRPGVLEMDPQSMLQISAAPMATLDRAPQSMLQVSAAPLTTATPGIVPPTVEEPNTASLQAPQGFPTLLSRPEPQPEPPVITDPLPSERRAVSHPNAPVLVTEPSAAPIVLEALSPAPIPVILPVASTNLEAIPNVIEEIIVQELAPAVVNAPILPFVPPVITVTNVPEDPNPRSKKRRKSSSVSGILSDGLPDGALPPPKYVSQKSIFFMGIGRDRLLL